MVTDNKEQQPDVKEKEIPEQKDEEVKSKKDSSKQKPKKEGGKRVFRQVNPRIMRNTRLVTLMEEDKMVGNKVVRGRTVRLSPNFANQYVLNPGAIQYDEQLEVLLAEVEKGRLEEVDPKTEGTPFVSEDEIALQKHESEARALRKKLGVPEPEIVI